MDNFPEELLAKIKSIQNLLGGGTDLYPPKDNLGPTVDMVTLTKKIEQIKKDVNHLDFSGSLSRGQLVISEENNTFMENSPPLAGDEKLEQTKFKENEEVKEWKDLRRFVVISKKGNYQDGLKRTYQCTICGYSETNSASQMQDHVETAHFKGAFKYTCPFCKKLFFSRCTLKRHERKVHRPKQEPSEVSTSNISDSIYDGKEPDDTNPNCVKVWSDFKKFICVKEKGKTGRNGKRSTFGCSICDHRSLQKSHLMNHIERQHFRDTFVYTCPVCGNNPSTRHALECHMREKHNKSRGDWSGLNVATTNDI